MFLELLQKAHDIAKLTMVRDPPLHNGVIWSKCTWFGNSLVEQYDLKEDKEGAYYTRNYIVHDYEGVDLGFIENILRVYLPKLKEKISKIKKDFWY